MTVKCLRVKEAQERYGLSRYSIMRVARDAGAIRKIGRSVRIDLEVMDEAINGCTVGGENSETLA